MESRNFIYAPRWVRVVALSVLTVALLSAIAVALYFLGEDQKQDWILIAMSLGQVAASGVVIAIVVFFSEKDVNVMDLQKRTERLFLDTFPKACTLIDFPRANSSLGKIADQLCWDFSRYREVSGYTSAWYFSEEAFDSNTYASIHLTEDFGAVFLEDERKKLFMANDIAAHTRGIMKDCRKQGIVMSYEAPHSI